MAQSRTILDPAEAIITALHQLGQTTAADIATAAGIAYSTTTRNLRELAAAGRVEKVADGKQTQWRLPTTATPHADTDAGAQLGTRAHTEAGTEVGVPATGLGTADAASPDETAGVATPADTIIAEATDEPADATDPTDDPADNAAADDQATDEASVPDDGAQPNSDRDDSEEDDTRSPGDQVEDGVQANRTDDVTADGSTAGTGIDAGSPDSIDTPDGAAADGSPTAATPAQTGATAKPRRASGTLDGAVLDVLEAHPDRGFKVSELCKLIDAANTGQDVSKASAGAVVLACQRLVVKGKAILAVEKPVTFQLIPADTTAAVAGPATGTAGR